MCWLQGLCAKLPAQVWPAMLIRELATTAPQGKQSWWLKITLSVLNELIEGDFSVTLAAWWKSCLQDRLSLIRSGAYIISRILFKKKNAKLGAGIFKLFSIVVQVQLSTFTCHTFPCPTHPHLSMSPSYMFLDDPSPSLHCYVPPPSPLVIVSLVLISMCLVIFSLFILLVRLHL